MATVKIPFDLEPDEQAARARAANVLLPEEFYALPAAKRATAFTVSNLAKLDQIQAVANKLAEMQATGSTFRDFQKWAAGQDWSLPKHRLETIYRNAAQNSYQAGHWRAFTEHAEAFPYLIYDSINDSRTRPSHLALDGVIKPVNDPFWKTRTPPLGHNSLLPDQRVSGSAYLGLEARYAGPAVEVVGKSGGRFSVTAHHPILTANRGWVDAQDLKKGDQLVAYSKHVCRSTPSADLNNNDLPPTIKEVFQSLGAHIATTMPRASVNLNGDIQFIDGDVNVVGIDRVLMEDIKASCSQLFTKLFFHRTRNSLCDRDRHRSLGVVSRAGKRCLACSEGQLPLEFGTVPLNEGSVCVQFDPARLQVCAYPFGIDVEHGCDMLNAKTRGIEFDGLDGHWLAEVRPWSPYNFSRPEFACLRFGSLRDTSVAEVFIGGFEINANAFRDICDAHPGDVEIDDVVDLRFFDFFGHVYDLQTASGNILAYGGDCQLHYVLSNCRCTLRSLSPSEAMERGGVTQNPPIEGQPDKGWGSDPREWDDVLARLGEEKAVKAPEAVRKAWEEIDFEGRGGKRPPMNIGVDETKDLGLSKQDGDARAYVLGNGRKTGHEYLCAYDKATGKMLVMHTDGLENGVGMPDGLKEAAQDRTREIVVHHNHPGDMPPSPQDIKAVGENKGVAEAFISAHDGSVYGFSPLERGNIERATVIIARALLLDKGNPLFANLSSQEYQWVVGFARLDAMARAGVISMKSNVTPGSGEYGRHVAKLSDLFYLALEQELKRG